MVRPLNLAHGHLDLIWNHGNTQTDKQNTTIRWQGLLTFCSHPLGVFQCSACRHHPNIRYRYTAAANYSLQCSICCGIIV